MRFALLALISLAGTCVMALPAMARPRASKDYLFAREPTRVLEARAWASLTPSELANLQFKGASGALAFHEVPDSPISSESAA
ncbi:hypothetical protein K474DRAFT_1668718 [Panus rudis PR-1116 ss-1]|nr:hypothetical protein K474DRAFT_1668718 [Panus rudis PR-1116 ss-1]